MANDSESQLGPLDALAVDEAHHTLLLDNEHVRVLDTCVRPGERTAVHTHEWPATLYVVSWSDFIRHDPDGNVLLDSRTLPSKPPPGSAIWSEPLPPHWLLNVGETELRVISVELKQHR
jgi:hypothetical protein